MEREIKQSELTCECWSIQCWGLDACKNCEFKDSEECGGKEVRKKLMNKLGHKVPLGKEI